MSLTLSEGRNRQVRRMTAHIGYPTLRLIRYRVGDWTLDGIPVGEYRVLTRSRSAQQNPAPSSNREGR